MKRICIIYTGGTIGMERGENGYEPGKEPFSEIMAKISDFSSPELPEYDVIEFSPLLDSSDITVSEWNLIGRTISDNMDKYDGFVIFMEPILWHIPLPHFLLFFRTFQNQSSLRDRKYLFVK